MHVAIAIFVQKTFRENHLTKRQVKNIGQLPQYFVEGSHQAIIEPEIFNAVQERLKKQEERYATTKLSDEPYPFTSKIVCGCCGKNYRRKAIRGKTVWICATYNTKGKKYCPTAKQIPENILMDVCCDILGIKEFDDSIVTEKIQKIIVPAPNELHFILSDGCEIDAEWQDKSRSESWTPEMKKAASERMIKWKEK